MMAMLWCNQILQGKKTFDQVPALLKDQVAELLVDAGYGHLAGIEEEDEAVTEEEVEVEEVIDPEFTVEQEEVDN